MKGLTDSLMEFIKILAYILVNVVSILFSLVPKNPRKIIFTSFPDYSDSSEYVYRKFLERKLSSIFKLIWIVNSNPLRENSVKKYSLKWLFHILTAKYIVSTHGPPLWKSKNQVEIGLWHGIPLKNQGLYSKGLGWRIHTYIYSPKIDYLIVTSKFTQKLFSNIFGLPIKKCVILEEPRCDGIYRSKDSATTMLRHITKVEKLNKIIFYLPTYRRMKGYSISSNEVVENVLNNQAFKDFLRENNLLLILKLHPLDEKSLHIEENENVRTISDSKLQKLGITIYDFLSAVDILLTDYSSIFYDFLLLNRPVIFYIPDVELYDNYAGFIIDPRKEFIPADKAMNIEELISALKEALENPAKYEKERLKLCKVFFQYMDNKSADRVVDFILKLTQSTRFKEMTSL